MFRGLFAGFCALRIIENVNQPGRWVGGLGGSHGGRYVNITFRGQWEVRLDWRGLGLD